MISMPEKSIQRVYDTLLRMPAGGLDAAKRLVWTELNYARAAEPLSTRAWPAPARALLAAQPLLLARHAGPLGAFDVIYVALTPEPDRRADAREDARTPPLSLSAERAIINQLLLDHPHALFLFSDQDERYWHLVNVKIQRDEGKGAAAAQRHVIRRIAVGPDERMRTAAERIAMLDLTTLAPDLTDLSPIEIQQRHDEAFDVEAVTHAFFTTYRTCFEAAEAAITGLDDAETLRLFTQRLFNRVLFIAFLERKGWLTYEGRSDYLQALWEAHQATREQDAEANFYRDRLALLFFAGLNNPGGVDIPGIHRAGFLQQQIGDVPYLNGGLFERAPLDEHEGVTVPDAVFAPLFDKLLYHYNFTVTESTPLDVEVAVDPEMLGRIFEELVTGRHESGSYYTPKPIVAFMCREALKGYLQDACPRETGGAVAALVDDRDARGLRAPEGVLHALRRVRACDPACGSGAYLLGMLHELMALRQALFISRSIDPRSAYDRKLEIIQHNLYGVDLDPFAVNIARLRLWLSLIVDFEGATPPPLPNLAYKIEAGDSLTGPAPQQLQPDLFHHQLVQDYFALKGEFMTAHGPEKQALRQRIAEVQREIAEWAGTAGDPGAFDWTVQFAEVFTAPGESASTLTGGMTGVVNAVPGQMQLTAQEGRAPGFDIVIANPPYVRQELQSQDQKARYKALYPEVYTGTADLYVYFYARALHLLRQGGVAAFISSNKWLRAGYGKKLRQHLKTQTTVNIIVDFGDQPLFGAIAYPQIIVFQNEPPEDSHRLKVLEIEHLTIVHHLSETVQSNAWSQPQNSLQADQGWALVVPEVRALLTKLRQSGLPLGQYSSEQVNIGIKTGFNRAFVIDQATRDGLVVEDPQSADLIKRWIRGRNVKRWRISWDGEYLIAIQNSDDENAQYPWKDAKTEGVAWEIFREHYPALSHHLSQYKERLRKRWDQGKYWWELRACAYYMQFEKPKILYPDIAKKCEFTYDEDGYLSGNTTYFLPTDDSVLLGILNSQVVEFFYRHITTMIQQDYLRFFTQYLQQVPIPEPTHDQRAAIEALVRKLLDAEGQGPQVAAWERELNALVYDVYDLTPDEVALVERETG
jgi:NOL1/NOP2/fmu family ribosome biogenesis protein